MALTSQDKAFLDKQKAKGLSFDEAWANLSSVKEKMGLTGGSFMTRAASVAENAPGASMATVDKGTKVKENFSAIGKEDGQENFNPTLGESAKEVALNALVPGGSIGLDLLKGGVKGVASAVSGASSLGEKMINTVLPDAWNSEGGTLFSEGKGQTSGEMAKGSALLQTEGTTEKVGKFIGENVLPAVAGGVAGASAKVLGGGSKVAQGLLGFLGSSAGGTTGYTVGAKGDLPTAKELAAGAVIDAATLGALKFLPKVLSGGKGALSKTYDLAKNKGLSPMTVDAVESLAKNTSPQNAKTVFDGLVDQEVAYLKNPIKNPSALATTGKELFTDFTENLLPQKAAIGSELASQIGVADDLAQAAGGLTSKGVLESLTSGLGDIGVKATATGLDFSGSKVRFSEANQTMLSKVYQEIQKYVADGSFIPPSEKWTLSQALGDLVEYNAKLSSQVTGAGELPIIKLKGDLMADVKSSLEESGQAVDLFDQYKTYSDAIDSLNLRLGEGGEGGFSILKALQGEQKFGAEVREALQTMQDITGKDYFEMVRQALAAAEIAGNTQVKSLLATTSKAGLLEEIVRTGFMDKRAILNRLVEETPDVARGTLEKTVSALAKILGVELVAGE